MSKEKYDWKIIVGKENKKITNPRTKETRKTTHYQIVSHDGQTFSIGDYEIIPYEEVKLTTNDGLPNDVLEIGGVYYQAKGSQKYMSDFNGIINVYIRDWKIAKPQYDIIDIKTAIKYFKELIYLKNELLGLK